MEKKVEIDEFIFTKKLGQGAFGDVYLGLQRDSDLTVAIKSVNKD